MYKMLQKKRGVMLMDDYIPNQVPCEEDVFLDDVPQSYDPQDSVESFPGSINYQTQS